MPGPVFMWRNWLGLILMLAGSSHLFAAEEREELLLWPEGQPAPRVAAEPAEVVETAADGTIRRTNISRARLVVYLPPADVKRTGAAVIVIPGGGFSRLSDQHEGWEACEWLAKQGIVSCLLLHRTPTHQQPAPNAAPVQDAQKAVSELRRQAQKFQIDPQKIGVLGFSAGGQVALLAATNPLCFPVKSEIPSHQPDFLLLLYPYQIYLPEKKALRPDILLDGKLPPMFIAQMGDDGGSLPQGSTLLYWELINRKVPAEIHIYERGGHGFGMRARPGSTGPIDWQLRAADWLQQHAWGSGLTTAK